MKPSIASIVIIASLVMITSCSKRINDLTVVNNGPATIHDAHVASSSGLSLRFGIVITNSHAAYHADGSVNYAAEDTFTLSWADEVGTTYSGTVQLPEDFSGNLEIVVGPDGKVTSRNGE